MIRKGTAADGKSLSPHQQISAVVTAARVRGGEAQKGGGGAAVIYWRPKTPNTTICSRRSSPPPRPAPATHVAGRELSKTRRGEHSGTEDERHPGLSAPRGEQAVTEGVVQERSPVKTDGLAREQGGAGAERRKRSKSGKRQVRAICSARDIGGQ
ncbi:hypothetical protein E2C01_028232 [Portunus trituberculatus]|uniref:Uncharacterized protein n=1 Tax=Portunus trituberculatus TaxID=210409 RepID=A0A5B7ENS4_PORTR|nr:hypothetical protein [Portunus trituberculatus]